METPGAWKPAERWGDWAGAGALVPWAGLPFRLKLGRAAALAGDWGSEGAGVEAIGAEASDSGVDRPKSGVMCLYCRHWLRRRAVGEGRYRQSSPEGASEPRPTPLAPFQPGVVGAPASPEELGREEEVEKSSCCAMAMLLYRRDEPQKG